MGKLEDIKLILQNTTNEIQFVQRETKRDDKISNDKIEKLHKLFDKSEAALKDLKNVHVTPTLNSSDIQSVIDDILKVRRGNLNSSVLQAIISSLQTLNNNLNDIRIDDQDHKRGQKVEKVSHDKL